MVSSSVFPSTSAIVDNLHLIISNAAVDPISGSVPRAYLGQIRRAG